MTPIFHDYNLSWPLFLHMASIYCPEIKTPHGVIDTAESGSTMESNSAVSQTPHSQARRCNWNNWVNKNKESKLFSVTFERVFSNLYTQFYEIVYTVFFMFQSQIPRFVGKNFLFFVMTSWSFDRLKDIRGHCYTWANKSGFKILVISD